MTSIPSSPDGGGPDASAGTSVLERTDASTWTDPRLQEPGDHERMSHYAKKEAIMAALLDGTPVVALCGKTWVPNKDPKKYPVCPTCKEIWETLNPGDPGDQDNGH